MPYIPKPRRARIKEEDFLDNSGELNFMIHDVINYYIQDHKLSYKTINEVVGALECVKLELYRRLAAPYEDKKKEENGDITLYESFGTKYEPT